RLPPRLPRAAPPPVGPTELPEQELGVLHGCGDPIVATHRGSSLGKGGEKQRVPLGEDLVVETGSWPAGPGLEQGLARLLDGRGPLQLAPVMDPERDVAPLEVARLGQLP